MELLKPIILLALCFSGCARPSPHPPAPHYSGVARTPPRVGDSLVIDSRAVVFFRQDSLRLKQIKAVLNDRVFATLTHDCYFEMKFARSVIQRDRPSLQVVNTDANRWLVFSKKDGARVAIDLNAINDLCGVFLFDGIKDPIRADMPNIETQLWVYYGDARN